MSSDAITRPSSTGRAISHRRKPPSAVLSFAAPIEAGKTTVSTRVAQRLSASRVSFGEYLRTVARTRGLTVTREILQELGEGFVSRDVRSFCEDVLEQQPWEPGRPLVIDGVRHVEVLDTLRELLAPAKSYLIYINVDRTTQTKRLKDDPLPHAKSLGELELHPTERQVRNRLPDRAALVLDGTQDPDESTRAVIEFLAAHDGAGARDPDWDRLNARRIALAEKKSRGELHGAELAEFDQLQTRFFDYLDAKHPRTPFDLDRLTEIEMRLRASGND